MSSWNVRDAQIRVERDRLAESLLRHMESASVSSNVDVSIIVVSFNTRELTLKCLESIYAQTQEIRFELIVVDNASADASADAIAQSFPDAALIASPENLGFAAANNLAAERASGRYILLLNPDTVVLDRAIDTAVRYADEHRDYAIFGCRTTFPDGSLNATSCWRAPSLRGLFCRALALDAVFPNSQFFNRDGYGAWQRNTDRDIEIASGCFLLIRREVWNELKGFDRDFFMYAEDWDLCMRARAAGHRARHCAAAQIIHYGGASEAVKADKMVRLIETKAKLCRKHWSTPKAATGVALLDLWVLLRLVGFRMLSVVRPQKKAAYTTWQHVWSKRGRWHAKK